ncbi:unnamed protein product [Caenorhabditis sp. 36 PRJEB53466]|nr:unnamed protein product [Caenorhabditis sp. 36 PRJEB53466]
MSNTLDSHATWDKMPKPCHQKERTFYSPENPHPDAEKYMHETRTTGVYPDIYPPHVWFSFPLEFKNEVRNRRKSHFRPQYLASDARDKISPEQKREHKTRPDQRRTQYQSQQVPIHLKSHEEELSDDNFTATYDAAVWSALPTVIQDEINRQRKLKLQRASNMPSL